MLRETNEKLRQRVRELTRQLKDLGSRPYAQPVTRPTRHRTPSPAPARGRRVRREPAPTGDRAASRGSVGSRASSVGSARSSRASSVARSGRGAGRFDPTAYVRERQERQAARRSRSNSRISTPRGVGPAAAVPASPAGSHGSNRSGASRRSGMSARSGFSHRSNASARSGAQSARAAAVSSRTGQGSLRPPRAVTGAAAVRTRPATARPSRSTGRRARPDAAAEPRRSDALAAAVARGSSRPKIWERSPSVSSAGSRGSRTRQSSGKTRRASGTGGRQPAAAAKKTTSRSTKRRTQSSRADHGVIGGQASLDAVDLLGSEVGAGSGLLSEGGARAPHLPPAVRREAWAGPPVDVPVSDNGGHTPDPKSELTDIDSRLRALQSFLREAKTSGSRY